MQTTDWQHWIINNTPICIVKIEAKGSYYYYTEEKF